MRVVSMHLDAAVSLLLLEDSDGWRFSSWRKIAAYAGTEDLPPPPREDQQRRFNSQEEAKRHFRELLARPR